VNPHPSADVFSAGVVLLELCVAALRRPSGAPIWSTVMERTAVLQAVGGNIIEQPPVLLALPAQLRALLRQMVDPRPSARPTAREALAALAAMRPVPQRQPSAWDLCIGTSG